MSKTVPVQVFRALLVDDYEALVETADILSDDVTLAAIRNGLQDLVHNDVVPLGQAREEHAKRART